MRIDVHGIELHWEEHGAGAPLVWLHGGMGCGSDWRYVFKEAPVGYRLLAPDLRGHGASTNPSGRFSFRQCAQDVLALLLYLELPRVKLVGLSGGGITALHMATADPARVESMVIVSAPPYFPEQARVLQRAFGEDAVGPAAMAHMRASHPRGEPQLEELFAMARGLADDYTDVAFTPPLLTTITAETLIVFGDRDPLYPVSLAFELRAAIPRAYLWVVPNGGHGPIFGDAAPGFVQGALAFLRGDWRSPTIRA